MSLGHSERELGKLCDRDLAKIVSGVHEAFKKRHSDLEDIPFPVVAIAISKFGSGVASIDYTSHEYQGVHVEYSGRGVGSKHFPASSVSGKKEIGDSSPPK